MQEDTASIATADLLKVLLRSKWWLLSAAVVFAVLAFLYSYTSTKMYRAEIVFVDNDDEFGSGGAGGLGGQFGDIASLVGISTNSDSERDVRLAILESRAFTESFITENDILREVLFDAWDEQSGQWKQTHPEKVPTIRDAFKRFDEKIRRVRVDTETGLIRMTVDWRDPEVAADWANQMLQRVNESIKTRTINDSRKTVSYLENELANANVAELRQGMARLIEAEISKIALANVRDDFAFKVIDPAVAPEIDDYHHPKPLFFGLLGGFLGLFTGGFLTLFRYFLKSPAPVTPSN